MKVKSYKEIDAVHCVAQTDKGEQHLTIDKAKSLMKESKKSATKKTKAN